MIYKKNNYLKNNKNDFLYVKMKLILMITLIIKLKNEFMKKRKLKLNKKFKQ